jgi:hypothetical protein
MSELPRRGIVVRGIVSGEPAGLKVDQIVPWDKRNGGHLFPDFIAKREASKPAKPSTRAEHAAEENRRQE